MWVLASVGLFVCLYGRLMIPRKEKITRVKAQGESFYPVKSKGDSSLGHQISVLPALYTSDGRKFTGWAPEPAESKGWKGHGDKATPGPLFSAFWRKHPKRKWGSEGQIFFLKKIS